MLIGGHQHRLLSNNFTTVEYYHKTISLSKASWWLIIRLRWVHKDCGVTCICAQPKIYRLYYSLFIVRRFLDNIICVAYYIFNNNWAHNISTKEFGSIVIVKTAYHSNELHWCLLSNYEHKSFTRLKVLKVKERKNSAFFERQVIRCLAGACLCVGIWYDQRILLLLHTYEMFVCVRELGIIHFHGWCSEKIEWMNELVGC